MNATTYNIPIELKTTGKFTIAELKEKLMAYAQILVTMSATEVHAPTRTGEHSAWVQSMSKYRRLKNVDDKEAMLEALDERF